jgi:membrane-bound acyltransferase YfiQ involved in biofilm formation
MGWIKNYYFRNGLLLRMVLNYRRFLTCLQQYDLMVLIIQKLNNYDGYFSTNQGT